MRKIELIVIHCSATKEGEDYDVSDIRTWHLRRGFRDVGYHFVIKLDGTLQKGRYIKDTGAHAKGYNYNSIGICYIGGLDKNGKPKDTRTEAQKITMKGVIGAIRSVFDESVIQVVGHRDLSTDLNGDGVISPSEWMKSCPCFDAKKEYNLIEI